jgi:hypothetical protein
MKPNIVEFVTDGELLGLSISPAQETLLRAMYGLPLSGEQREIYRLCTGRESYVEGREFGEVTVIAGARSGKDSRIAVPVALYEAIYGDHPLSVGELGMVPLVAQDAKGTRVAFGYAKTYLMRSPLLAEMLDGEPLSQEIRLANGFTISCFASTQRGLRAYSIPAAVLDELAFFRLEGQADSDEEIQASIRRGGLSFANPKLVKISTPYLRSGVLYADHKRAFGIDDPDLLVWVAGSTLMNPSISEARLARERRLDPVRSRREYDAGFSEEVGSFLSVGTIEMNTVPGRTVNPPTRGVAYWGAVDPSGGGSDAFTFAVCHHAAPDRIVHDLMRSWSKPRGEQTDLLAIVREIVMLAKSYNLRFVTGDRFGAQWLVQAFSDAGLRYVHSKRNRSECYLALEPLLLAKRVELLDHPVLAKELRLLERTNHPGGRVSIDHPKGAYHDDNANALAMAATLAEAYRPRDEDDEDTWERDRPEDGAVALARSSDAVAKWTEQLRKVGFTTEAIEKIVEESGEDCAEALEAALDDVTLRGRMKRAGMIS